MKKEHINKAFRWKGITLVLSLLLISVSFTVVYYEKQTSPSSIEKVPVPFVEQSSSMNSSLLDKIEYDTVHVDRNKNDIDVFVVVQTENFNDAEKFSAEYQTMLQQLNTDVQKVTIYLYSEKRSVHWRWKYTDHLVSYAT